MIRFEEVLLRGQTISGKKVGELHTPRSLPEARNDLRLTGGRELAVLC